MLPHLVIVVGQSLTPRTPRFHLLYLRPKFIHLAMISTFFLISMSTTLRGAIAKEIGLILCVSDYTDYVSKCSLKNVVLKTSSKS